DVVGRAVGFVFLNPGDVGTENERAVSMRGLRCWRDLRRRWSGSDRAGDAKEKVRKNYESGASQHRHLGMYDIVNSPSPCKWARSRVLAKEGAGSWIMPAFGASTDIYLYDFEFLVDDSAIRLLACLPGAAAT